MSRFGLPRIRRASLVGVGIVAVTAAALVDVTYAASTHPAPPVGTSVAAGSAGPGAGSAKPKPHSSGLPKAPKGSQPLGLTTNRTITRDRASKVRVSYPSTTALAQILVTIDTPPPANPLSHGSVFAHVFVTSPKHAKRPFGILPTVTVKALGFGAIPVTARLHAHQVVKNGKTQPLTLRYEGTFGSDAKGRFFESHPHLTGSLAVRISDVTIDGAPLPVGNACRSVPARLDLTAGQGYYTIPPYPKKLYIPFSAGGTLKGTLDIPAFHRCHAGSEDLNPLLTGLVGGPGNFLLIHQKGPLGPYPVPS